MPRGAKATAKTAPWDAPHREGCLCHRCKSKRGEGADKQFRRGFMFPGGLVERLELYAEQSKLSQADIVRMAVEEYLSKVERSA